MLFMIFLFVFVNILLYICDIFKIDYNPKEVKRLIHSYVQII